MAGHDLDRALKNLANSVPKLIDLSLNRIVAVLERVGSPHKKLPPVIHLAGTNGKGSTLAFLRSIYKTAGYRVHSYSSPHIVSFCERIYLNNNDVSPNVMATAIHGFLQTNITDVTYFEAITVIAFQLFAAHPADVLILETGLGGRGDATNVVEHKLATLLTPISMDHQDKLGDTIEKIAAEKIAICRVNTPIFCGKQTPSVGQMIIQAAETLTAPLFMLDRDFAVTTHDTGFLFDDLPMPPPSLYGRHQIDNAALAVACVRFLSTILPVSHDDFKNGLASATWPARLQRVETITYNLPPSWEIYVDGSHNQAGAETLRDFLETKTSERRILIMGCLARKDWRSIINNLTAWPTEIHLVPVTGYDTSWDTAEVSDYLGGLTLSYPIHCHPSWQQAIQNMDKNGTATTTVIITGSLYLAGDVLGEQKNV